MRCVEKLMPRVSVLCILIACCCPPLPASGLKGSRSAEEMENREADREGLARMKNDAQLARFKRAGLLVKLPDGRDVRVDPRLAPKWRWCRSWTAAFLRDTGRAHFEKFHRSFRVDSAVRTIGYEDGLRRRNANAAPAYGRRRSLHLTGAAVDIATKGMSTAEIRWMRAQLLELERRGFIVAVQEHYQPCFHVMVFDKYRGAEQEGEALRAGR